MNPMMQAMQQLQLMQQKMAETQAALGNRFVTEEVSGGLVRVTANGHGAITKLEIKPEAINAEEREMLEDLVITAVNKAIESAKAMAAHEMEQATGGMMPDIPGLNLPF